MLYAPLFIVFFSFLLCLWLSFASVLCFLIYLFLLFCVCGTALPMFYAFVFVFFLSFCVWGSVLPMFYASF